MYRGIIWDGEILRHDKPELENDFVFDRFVKQLEKINAVFDSGLLTSKSAIIIAPAGFSKMTFAYSCMQKSISKRVHSSTIIGHSRIEEINFSSG